MTTGNVATNNNSLDSSDSSVNKKRSLWTGILLIILGGIGVASPTFSTLVAESWLALILISAAGAKAVYAFQTRQQGGFIWKLLLSILYAATGIMLFFNPLAGVLTLTLLLGTFLLTEGVFELILAFRLRPQPNWTWALGNGLITLLLGAFVWFQWPSNAPWLLGTFVGASILATGVSRVMLSLNSKSDVGPSGQAPAV